MKQLTLFLALICLGHSRLEAQVTAQSKFFYSCPNQNYSGKLTGSSKNSTITNFTIDFQPINGRTNASPGGYFTYKPNKGFQGSDSFTFTATDKSGASATAPVFILVDPNLCKAPQGIKRSLIKQAGEF